MILTKEQRREIARLIENWARWYHGGRVGPKGVIGAPFPAYNLVNASSTRSDESNNLVISGEAEDIDRHLRRMHPEHVKALIVYHTHRGLPRTLALRCGCRTVRTYHRRVERASLILWRLRFPARAAGQSGLRLAA